MSKPETLILTAVHGDEGFSIPVVEKLKQKYDFGWIIANPKALEQGKRYLDADLNRSGPGNPKSNLFEERLAFRIINQAEGFKCTVDIHGTVSETGVFIILSDTNWQNIQFASKFDIANVVLWPGTNPYGPLTQFISPGIEIECGPKDSPTVAKELERVLDKFLSGSPSRNDQQLFIVTEKLTDVDPATLTDFQETTVKGKTFYPLFVGQYPGVSCYAMQKLNYEN